MKRRHRTAFFCVLLLLCALSLAGCLPETGDEPVPTISPTPSVETASPTAPESSPTPTLSPEELEAAYIDGIISGISMEERVRQLFIITLGPGTQEDFETPSEKVKGYIKSTAPGGFVLFTENITTVEGTKALTNCALSLIDLPPFIAIDEEGGRVSRLASARLDGYEKQPSAEKIGATEDTDVAYRAGEYIGAALKSIGVNLDFAPVADILTNPDNKVIGDRAFGSEPEPVGDMVAAFQRGLREQGVLSAPKHFPGHGGTAGDSHTGEVSLDYDEERLFSVEYRPFIRAIEEGAGFIMVGHIAAPKADPSGLPATLSPYFMTETLRNRLGFDGVIITDSMTMGAITDRYASGEAAVMAIQAGADMILMPENYESAVEGVLAAIDGGELGEERLNQSLRRILKAKISAGLIKYEY